MPAFAEELECIERLFFCFLFVKLTTISPGWEVDSLWTLIGKANRSSRYLSGLTMQYGTEGTWSQNQDTRCSNYGLILSLPLERKRPLRVKSKRVTFCVQ